MSLEQWKSLLKAELKADQIDQVLLRDSIHQLKSPILSTEALCSQVISSESKISLNLFDQNEMKSSTLQKWIDFGVREFFIAEALSDQFLKNSSWQSLFSHQQIVPILTGVAPTGTKQQPLSARKWVCQGANLTQELVSLYQQWQKCEPNQACWVEVYLDGDIFHNLAKIRALKILCKNNVKIIGRVSPRFFSVMDEENNILKNALSVASGFMAGVDVMESLNYQILRPHQTDEEKSRADYLAVSTQIILSQESHLQFVQDPAFGSWSIENLTRQIIHLVQSSAYSDSNFKDEVSQSRSWLDQKVNERKVVLTGINDYPDPQQKLPTLPQDQPFYRPAFVYEQLKWRVQQLSFLPKILLLVQGDQVALQARINFIKNIVEILGVETSMLVTQFPEFPKMAEADVVIWIAKDEDYPSEISITQKRLNFIAGKKRIIGAKNIFQGGPIHEILDDIVKHWEQR